MDRERVMHRKHIGSFINWVLCCFYGCLTLWKDWPESMEMRSCTLDATDKFWKWWVQSMQAAAVCRKWSAALHMKPRRLIIDKSNYRYL